MTKNLFHFCLTLATLLVLSGVRPLYGKTPDFQFIHFNKENSELPYNSIKDILEDSRGFVWIGTNKGLCRYDGTRFRNYYKEDFGNESDFICSLCEDRSGNIWIGTDKGLVVYDYVSDSFFTKERCEDKIFSIVCDGGGTVWAGSRQSKLFRCRDGGGNLEIVSMGELSSSDLNLYALACDSNGRVWVSVYCDNVYFLDDSGKFSPLDISGTIDFSGDDIGGIAVNGNFLYVASKHHGLCEVDLKRHSVREMFALPPSHRPLSLRLTEGRYLWMGTTCGLVRYDLAGEGAIVMGYNPEDRFTLSDDQVTASCVDRSGGLWVGTLHNGVNYSSPHQRMFRKIYSTDAGESLKGSLVRCFSEDASHRLWVATERSGIYLFDPATGCLDKWKASSSIPKYITALCADNEWLWIGGQNGISRIHEKTGQVRSYRDFGIISNISDNRIVTLFRSRHGDVYAGTTAGVMRFDEGADCFRTISSLGPLVVEKMAEDKNGLIWMASYAFGTYAYDPVEDRVSGHWPLDGMTSSVVADDDGNIWVIGFSNGFYRYDRQTDDFVSINRSNLPLLPTDVYLSGLFDARGRLWLGTNVGLVEYDGHDGGVKLFTVFDGVLDNDFKKTSLRLTDGTMVFGSENGFIHFDPGEFDNDMGNVSVHISEFNVNGKQVPSAQSGGNPDVLERITLLPSESTFGFAFSTPSIPSNSYGRILCRLRGYDRKWVDISSDKTASWYNVSSGQYTLEVGVANSGDQPAYISKMLEITVKPTFWQSGAGVAILAVVILSLSCACVFLVYRRTLKMEKKKQEDNERRLKDELYQEKMVFFTNIIHEIKTPLSLIQIPLRHVLARDNLSEDISGELRTIGDNCEYMDQLVKELLDFVRVEKHGYDLVIKSMDIVERLGFMCFNFAEIARSKNITLKYRHDEDCIFIDADESALNKMLNNLLHNAVKYAETSIDVHVYQQNDEVSVTIRNDGPPIPEEHREDIFKPFVQYSSDTSPYSQSFGIGLSLARTFANMHKGTLFLDPDPKCTKFVLRLPSRVVENNNSVSSFEGQEKPDAQVIEIVENNKDLLNYLKTKLGEKYNVLACTSAESGLAVLRKHQVDLLITDVALQSMSGIELCRKVSSDHELQHIPIIVVSAISSDDVKISCMESGASLYIEKPFNLNYLFSCISGLLGKSRTSRVSAATAVPDAVDMCKFDLPDADDVFLKRLETVIAENLGDSDFTNRQMEEKLYMSHSTLNRKVKALLGTTPSDYLKTKRLAVAAHLLEFGEARINEVCYTAGFTTPSYFAKCFKNQYGMLPAEYRKKFTGEK